MRIFVSLSSLEAGGWGLICLVFLIGPLSGSFSSFFSFLCTGKKFFNVINLLMEGFEPRISCAGSVHSADRATTTANGFYSTEYCTFFLVLKTVNKAFPVGALIELSFFWLALLSSHEQPWLEEQWRTKACQWTSHVNHNNNPLVLVSKISFCPFLKIWGESKH